MNIEQIVLKAMNEIPFENSNAQTDSIINSALTPERAYRQLGIRFMKRWNDLKICSIERRKSEIKVKRMEKELAETSDELDKEELQLEIEKIKTSWPYEDKLAGDCKAELLHIVKRLKQLPCYDRKMFEEAEKQWLEMKHNNIQFQNVISLMEDGHLLNGRRKFEIETNSINEIKGFLNDNK